MVILIIDASSLYSTKPILVAIKYYILRRFDDEESNIVKSH